MFEYEIKKYTFFGFFCFEFLLYLYIATLSSFLAPHSSQLKTKVASCLPTPPESGGAYNLKTSRGFG